MIKTIKIKLKPNKCQKSLLFQCSGTARWAYNWTLGKQEEIYKASGKFISDGDLRKELTQLKKTNEYKWLFAYSNNITKQAIKDACDAYKRFFKGLTRKPKFKSRKKSKPSFFNDNVKLKFTNSTVHLEKIGKIKLAEKNRVPLESKYYNPRITFDGLSWWLSVGIDFDIMKNTKEKTEGIGIDLGIKELAVISNGSIYENINKTPRVKKVYKKLKKVQRSVSRKYEMNKNGKLFIKTNNIIKSEKIINRLHKKLANIRTNYIHKITSTLVKTNPEFIVMEDLDINGMMKNRHLSKAIQEQKLFEFRRQIEYKCKWNDVKILFVGRFYPSSKLCSSCGQIKKDLKLSDRVYNCNCGYGMDRDLNAAMNLMNYGLLQ